MGGKRARIWKHLNFCLTLVACFGIVGCALSNDFQARRNGPSESPKPRLARSQELFARYDYDGALEENQRALAASDNKPPADEALFNIGVLYAYPANPKKDIGKSTASFRRMVNDFPQSPWVPLARAWIDTLNEIERLRRVSAEASREMDRMRQETEKLKRAYGETLQEADKLKKTSADVLQENEKLKRASAELLAENAKLKKIVEESRMVDIEIDEKKRNQAK
jgi:hypothetical protein